MSASCSPALARKTSLDTSGNTEISSNTNEEQGCSEAVSSMSNQVRKHLLSPNNGILCLHFPFPCFLCHKPPFSGERRHQRDGGTDPGDPTRHLRARRPTHFSCWRLKTMKRLLCELHQRLQRPIYGST